MPSNPLKSRRAKILNNLIRQLQTITVTNNYSRDVYKVTTDVKAWIDTPAAETPTVYVIDERTTPEYHAGKLLNWSWIIGLYGVMRNQTQLDMEEFIADVIECLTKNQRLAFSDTGPVSAHFRVKEIATDSQLFSEIEGSQLFKISIEIIYTSCVDNVR